MGPVSPSPTWLTRHLGWNFPRQLSCKTSTTNLIAGSAKRNCTIRSMAASFLPSYGSKRTKKNWRGVPLNYPPIHIKEKTSKRLRAPKTPPKNGVGLWHRMLNETPSLKLIWWVVPLPVTVTTRIIRFFVGDPYKPSFATGILGGGTTQLIYH